MSSRGEAESNQLSLRSQSLYNTCNTQNLNLQSRVPQHPCFPSILASLRLSTTEQSVAHWESVCRYQSCVRLCLAMGDSAVGCISALMSHKSLSAPPSSTTLFMRSLTGRERSSLPSQAYRSGRFTGRYRRGAVKELWITMTYFISCEVLCRETRPEVHAGF